MTGMAGSFYPTANDVVSGDVLLAVDDTVFDGQAVVRAVRRSGQQTSLTLSVGADLMTVQASTTASVTLLPPF